MFDKSYINLWGEKLRMMMRRIVAGKWSISLLPSQLNYSATFTSRPQLLTPPAQQYNSDTGYQTLVQILEACKSPHDLRSAIAVHAKIVKHGYGMYPSMLSLLISIYITCQCSNLACELQKEIYYQNVDIVSANLIISSFMKIGETNIAKKIFQNVPSRDVVTWNSLIGGCVKNASFQEALSTFREMLRTRIEPDGFTFASTIAACARLGALHHGKWIHSLVIEKRIEPNYILSSALIDMYAKCGQINIAKEIFDGVQRIDVSIWNAMINGLAIHGLALDAIAIFSRMKGDNISPNSITFIGILTACSHCGLVEEGRKHFDLMRTLYLIQPQLEHYGAMVDLLGRAGLLEEAYGLIKEMTVEPDIVIWRALLSACRMHKNSELGEIAIEKISHLSSGDYVLMSNIYCSIKNWDSSEGVRYMMKEKGVHKCSGKSWLEFGGAIHQFNAGDKSHREAILIYKVLEALIQRTKMEGFMPETDLVLMDVSEEEKEENLNYHSEKLAVAYGILKSSPGAEILISKNLRTCLDCHSWLKVVSKLLNRVIIVRDRIRFHRFERGTCTCRDYW